MRGKLERHSLTATSANYDWRHTYFGEKGRTSLLDHTCLPEGLTDAVVSAGPLYHNIDFVDNWNLSDP